MALLLLFVATVFAGQPNILLFYVDDLGYGQLGCYGNKEVPTPNIDAIAAKGIRFTQGYVSAPLCSPSRAGLMSGHYQERFGHDNNSVWHEGFPNGETTLPQRMKTLGYATGIVGKWHLSDNPVDRGFDEFYGSLGNPLSYMTPKFFVDSRISLEPKMVSTPGFYTTDAYTDRACDWITKNKEKSWFLYLAYNAVHGPHSAPQKYLDRFKSLSPAKNQMSAAVLSALDDGVGVVMKKLQELGLEENTLVYFISDNGSPTAGSNGALRGTKHFTWEGGIRVPFMMQWKGKLPAGVVYEKPVIQLDVMPTCVAVGGGTVDPLWKLDGVDLIPYLTGAKTAEDPHDLLMWRIDGKWAVRFKEMKLVHGDTDNTPPELFDLGKDTGEKVDLAKQYPEKVAQFKTMWDQWNSQMAPPPASEGEEKENTKKEKKGKQAAAGNSGNEAKEE